MTIFISLLCKLITMDKLPHKIGACETKGKWFSKQMFSRICACVTTTYLEIKAVFKIFKIIKISL